MLCVNYISVKLEKSRRSKNIYLYLLVPTRYSGQIDQKPIREVPEDGGMGWVEAQVKGQLFTVFPF